jgi:hypothetical protein
MEIEITPEPTEDERAAIVAALAEDDETPSPAPWQDDPVTAAVPEPFSEHVRGVHPL